MKPHRFERLKHAKRYTTQIHWVVCRRCGLVLLRNEATERAAKKPCGGLEDDGDPNG